MEAGLIVNGYAIHPGANLTGADLTGIIWRRTTCPDGVITDTAWEIREP